jgi:sterol 14-demethylase
VNNPAKPHRGSRLPPPLEPGLPWLGHALTFYRNPVGFLLRARQRLGDILALSLAGNHVAFLSGPRANEAFFRAPDDQLSIREAYQFTVPVFGPGVVFDTSAARRGQEISLVLPLLNERRLRDYTGYIQEEVEEYVRGWGDEGVFDLPQLMNELAVFIPSRCLIGQPFRRAVDVDFARLIHQDLAGGLNQLAFFLPNLPTAAHRRRDRARLRIARFIGQIITERRNRGGWEGDFLQTLMNARRADGTAFTDEAIIGNLLGLLVAGQHTSAALAEWTGIELLRHPDYLQRVLREQDEVMGGGGVVTFDAMEAMVVLERALRETERLHPVPAMLRRVLRDFEYRDYVVPVGWLAMVSPAVTHLLPEVFADPQRYDPDRFGPGREEHLQDRFSMISFGGGQHACTGMAFARLEIRVIWSTLLRRFDLRLLDRNIRPDPEKFWVPPRKPCRVAYRRRRSRS